MDEVTALIGLYAKYHEIPNRWATINEEWNRQWPTRQRTVKQMKDKWKTLQELIPPCQHNQADQAGKENEGRSKKRRLAAPTCDNSSSSTQHPSDPTTTSALLAPSPPASDSSSSPDQLPSLQAIMDLMRLVRPSQSPISIFHENEIGWIHSWSFLCRDGHRSKQTGSKQIGKTIALLSPSSINVGCFTQVRSLN